MKVYFIGDQQQYENLKFDYAYTVLNEFYDDDVTLYNIIDDNGESEWINSIMCISQEEYRDNKIKNLGI